MYIDCHEQTKYLVNDSLTKKDWTIDYFSMAKGNLSSGSPEASWLGKIRSSA